MNTATITIRDKELEVDYFTQKGESGTFIYGAGGSPPIPDTNIVEGVFFNGIDVTSTLEYLGLDTEIEEQIQDR